LAILPIAPTDLGRDAEVEIGPGGKGKTPPTNAVIGLALTVSLLNMRKQRVPVRSLDLEAVTSRTWGAFVLEMGDAEQHGSFDSFVRYIEGNTLSADWRADRNL